MNLRAPATRLRLAIISSQSRARQKAAANPVLEEPLVRVVLSQDEPVLGPRGEHAVRLVDLLRHEIVDEDSDIRLVPSENERALAREAQRRR